MVMETKMKCRILWRLIRFLWHIGRKEIVRILVFSIISGCLPLLQIQILRHFIDSAINFTDRKQNFSSILIWIVALLLSYLTSSFFYWQFRLNTIETQGQLRAKSQDQLLLKVEKLPLIAFEEQRTYDALARANSGMEGQLSSTITNLLGLPRNIIIISGLIVYFLQQNALFLLVLIGGSVCATAIQIKEWRRQYLVQREQTPVQRRLDYISGLLQSREGAAELRILQLHTYLLRQRDELLHQVRTEQRKSTDNTSVSTGANGIASTLTLYGIASLSAWKLSHGKMTVGIYLSFFVAVQQFQQAFLDLCWDTAIVFKDLAFIGDFFDFIDIDEEASDAKQTQTDSTHEIVVEFRNVSFAYPGTNMNAVTDLSFTIRAGQKIAIIGSNGSGKSTLIKLMLGLYKPTQGEIYVFGVELSSLHKRAWLSHIAVVFQDFMCYLFNVKDNIELGDIYNKDGNDVKTAMVLGGIDSFIESLPNGIATLLGPQLHNGGVDLSGGQWQRLAIARAYFRNSSIVFLDEPTASLDPMAEYEQFRRFADIASGKTAVLISHRLGVARLSDHIIVMSQGCLVEQGSHSELLKKSGMYSEMLNLQAKWYDFS